MENRSQTLNKAGRSGSKIHYRAVLAFKEGGCQCFYLVKIAEFNLIL